MTQMKKMTVQTMRAALLIGAALVGIHCGDQQVEQEDLAQQDAVYEAGSQQLFQGYEATNTTFAQKKEITPNFVIQPSLVSDSSPDPIPARINGLKSSLQAVFFICNAFAQDPQKVDECTRSLSR